MKAGLINSLKVSLFVCVCLSRSWLAETVLLREQEGTFQTPRTSGLVSRCQDGFLQPWSSLSLSSSIYFMVQLHLLDLCGPGPSGGHLLWSIALPCPHAPQDPAITRMHIWSEAQSNLDPRPETPTVKSAHLASLATDKSAKLAGRIIPCWCRTTRNCYSQQD